MSKTFALNLSYLGQRKYRSGKMYRMTFPQPWPKVIIVPLIKKIACLHDYVRTAHAITTKLGRDIPQVMFITWKDFGEIMLELFLAIFSPILRCDFSRSNTLLAISLEWMVQLMWMKRKCVDQIWDYYTETGHFPATHIIELFETLMHCVLLLCQSNCITTQNPVERPVCVGSGVLVVNTGIAKVTELLNEARTKNPHHRFLRSHRTPCLICMVRHINNTFSWPQKMLRYSWQDMFNCRIIFCHNIFGWPVFIIHSMS